MLKTLFSVSRGEAAAVWPRDKVVGALESRFDRVEILGENAEFALYGISDHGVNFVIALAAGPGSTEAVAEIGFMALFIGFDPQTEAVERLNGSLNLAVASLEPDGDLFLLASLPTQGAFDETSFMLVLEAWRRDLTLTLHALSGEGSLAGAFAFAAVDKARSFAANRAPEGSPDVRAAVLRAFLDARGAKALCDDCNGRGRRGLIARLCETCRGAGFVSGAAQ